MSRLTLVLPAILGACQAAAPATTPPSSSLTVVPDGDGLRIEGSGLEVSFGRAEAGAVAAIESILGDSTGPLPCPLGGRAYRFDNGLEMVFTGTQFTGWRDAEGRRIGTTC